jgi:hypothetical protein
MALQHRHTADKNNKNIVHIRFFGAKKALFTQINKKYLVINDKITSFVTKIAPPCAGGKGSVFLVLILPIQKTVVNLFADLQHLYKIYVEAHQTNIFLARHQPKNHCGVLVHLPFVHLECSI